MAGDFEKWYALNLNPEPWRIGPMGWKVVNGRRIQLPAPDPDLQTYQKAVREQLEQLLPVGTVPYDGLVEFEFFFWRQLDSYETDTKKSQRHIADATNLQKALEDALQGVLITNDRNVRRVCSHLVEQAADTVPAVAIRFASFTPDVVPLPAWMYERIATFSETPGLNFDNSL